MARPKKLREKVQGFSEKRAQQEIRYKKRTKCRRCDRVKDTIKGFGLRVVGGKIYAQGQCIACRNEDPTKQAKLKKPKKIIKLPTVKTKSERPRAKPEQPRRTDIKNDYAAAYPNDKNKSRRSVKFMTTKLEKRKNAKTNTAGRVAGKSKLNPGICRKCHSYHTLGPCFESTGLV